MTPALAVLADAHDPIALCVAERARARGALVHHLDFHGAQPIAWDGESWLLAGVELSALAGVLVRARPPEGAMLDADPQRAESAERWWRAGLEQRARAQLGAACLRDLAARGVRVVNVPSIYDDKPTQLAALARAGLPVPRTLVTNFAPALSAFAADVGEVVIKPVLGGAEAELLGEVDAAALARAPTIAQARAHGADVRVTVVDGQVISAVEIPSSTLDYRSQPTYRQGALEYAVHALSAEGRDVALAAAALTGQILSGVDLKHGAHGRYTLLEANSAPVYLDIERKTGAPISDAVVTYLLGGR